MSTALAAYERAFAQTVAAERAFAFWKGRIAEYAILKALGVGAGDEVILPGYTCVMDVNPIVYLGATPVYVDIEPDTYNIDPDLLEQHITPKTKVIIAQHTYGYPVEMDRVMGLAASAGVPVVEDCCLALGSTYKGKRVSSFGVASYWSSQWNKPFTTGLGGMATTADRDLAERIESVCTAAMVAPTTKEVAMLGGQLAAYRTLVYPRTTALAQTIFRWLTKKGAVVGSSSRAEYAPTMGEDFFKGMSRLQARVGLDQLSEIDRFVAHRSAMRQIYDTLLAELGWPHPCVPAHTNPVLVRYPVRVADKPRALATAARHLIELGSWFECPLHPIETPLRDYGYEPGLCPQAERASREVVNLPVHPRANAETARRTVDFIAQIGPPQD